MSQTSLRSPVTQALLPALPLAFAALANSAEAQIVYTNIPDATLSKGATIDLDFGDGEGFNIGTTPFGGTTYKARISAYGYSQAVATQLSAGSTINGATFSSGASSFVFLPDTSGPTYFALRVQDWNTSDYFYGWVQATVSGNGTEDTTVIVYDYARELTVGQGIVAGQTSSVSAIPEPSTYAALAGIAAVGAVVYQRRRRKAA